MAQPYDTWGSGSTNWEVQSKRDRRLRLSRTCATRGDGLPRRKLFFGLPTRWPAYQSLTAPPIPERPGNAIYCVRPGYWVADMGLEQDLHDALERGNSNWHFRLGSVQCDQYTSNLNWGRRKSQQSGRRSGYQTKQPSAAAGLVELHERYKETPRVMQNRLAVFRSSSSSRPCV